MTRTITALFDSRSDAEAGVERLHQAGLDADHVKIHDQSSHTTSGAYSNHEDRGLWSSIKNAFLPDEDRHAYEEGVRRGGFLVTADVDEDKADDAVRALEEANSIDLDDRTQSWRAEGWDYPAQGGLGVAGGAATAGANNVSEDVIPIVEEQLVVGKREVDRGGVRVRSYVSEVPVHEQVRLRQERINVERRAVDQPLSAVDGDAFRERVVDVTASSEEAVVAKEARVVEEVVVSKTSGERTEEINDTVRHTEVDIDEDGPSTTDRT